MEQSSTPLTEQTQSLAVRELALVTSVAAVKRLERRPDVAQMEALAAPWRPWRSVAARLFWHDYLSRRGKSGPGPASSR